MCVLITCCIFFISLFMFASSYTNVHFAVTACIFFKNQFNQSKSFEMNFVWPIKIHLEFFFFSFVSSTWCSNYACVCVFLRIFRPDSISMWSSHVDDVKQMFFFFLCVFCFLLFIWFQNFFFFLQCFKETFDFFFFFISSWSVCWFWLRESVREKSLIESSLGGNCFVSLRFFFTTHFIVIILLTQHVCVLCVQLIEYQAENFSVTQLFMNNWKWKNEKKNFCSGIQVRTQKHRTNFVLFFTGKKNVHSFKKKRKKLNSIQFHSWYSGMQIFLFSFCFTCHFVFPLILYLKINSFSPGVHTHTHLTFIHTFARNTGVTIVSDCVCVCLYVNKFLIDRPKYEKKKETKTSTKFFISKNK